MQNIVYIMPTRFVDEMTGVTTFGYKIFDNTSQTYDNTWSKMITDPDEVFKWVVEHADLQTMEILDRMCDTESDVVVGKTLIKFSKYRKIIEDCDFSAQGRR